ncbi:hypothetical protein ES707_03627 [subsurface metagenome]
MERECLWCGRELGPDNSGKLCFLCASELAEVMIDLPEVLDVEDVRKLLHFEDAESVRRMYRRGDLPKSIKGVKKLLWFKDDLIACLKSGQTSSVVPDELAQAISLALQLGMPIDRSTLYGHVPGNLIDLLKQSGYLQGSKDQPQ